MLREDRAASAGSSPPAHLTGRASDVVGDEDAKESQSQEDFNVKVKMLDDVGRYFRKSNKRDANWSLLGWENACPFTCGCPTKPPAGSSAGTSSAQFGT